MSLTVAVSALSSCLLHPFTATLRGRQPWYGSSMQAQPQSVVNGEPVRRSRPSAVLADDGLYRYEPVPPVGRDEDGYLVEDGMSQIDKHLSQTTLWYHALKRRLPTATVCSDLPLHYQLGDTDKTLVPDLFVALRAPRREDRRSYKLWEEPVPDLVMEMLSKNTSKADIGLKRATYEHLGVRECWLFDPEGFELPTPLVGQRLLEGRYRRDRGGRGRAVAERGAGPRPARPQWRTAFPRPGDGRGLEDLRRGRRQRRRGEGQSRGGRRQSRRGEGQSRRGEAQGRRGRAQGRRGRARVGAAATPTKQIRLGRRCINVGLVGALARSRYIASLIAAAGVGTAPMAAPSGDAKSQAAT